jgi:hypothetical protein
MMKGHPIETIHVGDEVKLIARIAHDQKDGGMGIRIEDAHQKHPLISKEIHSGEKNVELSFTIPEDIPFKNIAQPVALIYGAGTSNGTEEKMQLVCIREKLPENEGFCVNREGNKLHVEGKLIEESMKGFEIRVYSLHKKKFVCINKIGKRFHEKVDTYEFNESIDIPIEFSDSAFRVVGGIITENRIMRKMKQEIHFPGKLINYSYENRNTSSGGVYASINVESLIPIKGIEFTYIDPKEGPFDSLFIKSKGNWDNPYFSESFYTNAYMPNVYMSEEKDLDIYYRIYDMWGDIIGEGIGVYRPKDMN